LLSGGKKAYQVIKTITFLPKERPGMSSKMKEKRYSRKGGHKGTIKRHTLDGGKEKIPEWEGLI